MEMEADADSIFVQINRRKIFIEISWLGQQGLVGESVGTATCGCAVMLPTSPLAQGWQKRIDNTGVGVAPGGSAADEHPEVPVVHDATTSQIGVQLAGRNAA